MNLRTIRQQQRVFCKIIDYARWIILTFLSLLKKEKTKEEKRKVIVLATSLQHRLDWEHFSYNAFFQGWLICRSICMLMSGSKRKSLASFLRKFSLTLSNGHESLKDVTSLNTVIGFHNSRSSFHTGWIQVHGSIFRYQKQMQFLPMIGKPQGPGGSLEK